MQSLCARGFSLGLIALLVGALPAPAAGQTWIQFGQDGTWYAAENVATPAPDVAVPAYDAATLDVLFDLPGVRLEPAEYGGGAFVRVSCPQAPLAGAVGTPGLPVIRRLFTVPQDAAVALDVWEHAPVVVDLRAAGFAVPVLPMRAPLSLLDSPALAGEYPYDAAAYAADDFAPAQRVVVTKIGEVRHRDLYLLEARPVAYNPGAGLLVAWPRLDVRLSFSGGRDLTGLRTASGMLAATLNPPPGARGPETGGKLLLVIAQDFVGTAPVTQFINFKTSQGFTVNTYVPPVGQYAPVMRTYLQSLYGTPDEPDYILIVGDANYNAWQIESGYVVAWYSLGTNYYCRTDIPYACLNDANDWIPDVPIGRFPARTVSELQSEIDKTIYVETGNYADPSYTLRAAMAAGPEPLANAEAVQNNVIDTYLTPAGIESNKLYYATYGARTQQLAAAYNGGVFLGTYFGHAAGFQAWGAPAFTFADIEALTNVDRYPFLVSMSCSGTAFHYTDPTQSPGFVEKWFLQADKGAVGGWGHAWSLEPYTFGQWSEIYTFFMHAIYADGLREVGAAAQAAAAYFVGLHGPDDPVSKDFTMEFLMQGDPSLRLPVPPADTLLIVAAPSYVGSTPLNQFVAHKQARGLNVNVYSVPVGSSTQNIKDYIKNQYNSATPPKYVLIVGDAASSTSTSTTIPYYTGVGSKHASTDLYYGCMDTGDDWYPEIAVGRFAIVSQTELQAIVDKTVKVETGNFSNPDYVKRAAFLANPDTYNTAEPTAEWIISTYLEPAGYTPVRIYAAQGGSTADVTSAINTGTLFVSYMGHSGSSGWWDPAFNQSNIQALSNTGLYPLAFGWSCNTAKFETSECFGETWIRQANKGAVGYLSASNYIYWGSVEAWRPSGILEKAFFTAMFDEQIWNVRPAWDRALELFLDEFGVPDPNGQPTQNADICRNFFEEFVLLGDPSLRLPQPNGFELSANPASQSVCVPPASAAVFTVTVDQIGTFQEPVTLNVTGVPTGASVAFSQNNVAPPFVSVLTVGNLQASMVGQYSLTITGTSASKQDSAPALLTVSNALPAVPALTSPPNGAEGVSRTPTLTWNAVAQAADYSVEVATDANFTQVVWFATTPTPTATVAIELNTNTTYYWHVRAGNGCGASQFSAPFHFTTLVQRDYFTELFAGGGDNFDLDNITLFFLPDGSGNYYYRCGAAAAALPTDPNGGTALTLSDDGSVLISFGNPVGIYGQNATSVYVNANGNITWGSSDGGYNESLAVHFSKPRVAAVFDDLNPATGGQVSWKQLGDRIAVTWFNVPEYGSSNQNTFQIELFFNGEIHVTWLAIAVLDALAGLSDGNGQPGDFLETNLSNYGVCQSPGACCQGESCTVTYESTCLSSGGTFEGAGTDCDPNPCLVAGNSACLIFSEVVQGTESGDCPRWIEITNTGTAAFTFPAGGVIVQTGNDNDVTVDINLGGVTIAAGDSYVINSNANGSCTGAFQGIYSFPADLSVNFEFGYGNERFILTDTADGSNLLDIYGVFGVNGSGQAWEYTDGYSNRLPPWNSGSGDTFMADEWLFGGVGSLAGPDPTALLLSLTTPGTHVFDDPCTGLRGDCNCDGVIDFNDINAFVLALTDPTAYGQTFPGCDINHADANADGAIDFGDINRFVALLSQ